MVRQKVKGTGHKQPSDASSEPNFYSMEPVEPEYPNQQQIATIAYGAPYSNNQQTIMPPYQASAAVPPPSQPLLAAPPAQAAAGVDPHSPGFSSLHGAAQLLHGIAAGKGGGAFLGPPATSNDPAPGTSASASLKQKPASFLWSDDITKTEV